MYTIEWQMINEEHMKRSGLRSQALTWTY